MILRFRRPAFAVALALLFAPPAAAQLVVPAYESRPGAAYTLYLNFAGFSFTGRWGTSNQGNGNPYLPGVTPAYSTDGNVNSFSSTELANIKNIWSRTAEKYAPFNVNVTTVDPAVAAGQAGSDAQRQAYYDTQPRMMQTVIGGSGGWSGGGGVSYLSTAQNSYNPSGINGGAGYGWHTNWVFSAQAPSNLQFVAEASAHEDGHAMRLSHQSLFSGNTLVNTYNPGTGTGNGSQAPIMGNSYSAQRGQWKVGTTGSNGNPTIQNDVHRLMGNNGIGGYVDDGIGNSLATATPLPLLGTTINSDLAKGIITPVATSNPNPTGEANYTADYFLVVVGTGGGQLDVTLRSGRSTITPGVADPGATLDATLQLLDSTGGLLVESSSGVLIESISRTLSPGSFYLRVSSAGDPLDRDYFDMGSFFLTGAFVPVPEPGMLMGFAGLVVVGWVVRRKRVTAVC